MKNQTIIFGVVALILGVAAGYYFGLTQGKKSGEEEVQKIQAELDAARKEQAKTLPTVVNPAEKLPETNPLKEVETNPFKGGEYVNPFK